MADVEEAPAFDPTLKKKKKVTVAFATDTNGEPAEPTAENHTADAAEGDADAELFKGLKKKKKSKDADAAGDEAPDFDMGLKKKKKKKVTKTKDFDAELEKAGITTGDAEEGAAPAEEAEIAPEDAGDVNEGTGVWAHESTANLTYPLLLSRFFTLLKSQHPDLAGDGRARSYKIPPPQCMREGNKKTIFANIADICKKMKRSDEHVTQYLFAELGTSGSVDGSRRLVIKGKFQQKQIENVLRRYIHEYVTCMTCKSPDTDLKKGENRLYFVTCNSCGSRRSVSAIKTGFQAHIGKRRRAVG